MSSDLTAEEVVDACKGWADTCLKQVVDVTAGRRYLILGDEYAHTENGRERHTAYVISTDDLDAHQDVIARVGAIILDLNDLVLYRPKAFEPLPGEKFGTVSSLGYVLRGGPNTKTPRNLKELIVGQSTERAALIAFAHGLRMAYSSIDGQASINTLEMDPRRFYVHAADHKVFALSKDKGRVKLG